MFSRDDLLTVTDYVADAWARGADRDWSVNAGTLEWSCAKAADHAYDATLAVGYFLASRRQDRYPDWGDLFSVGADATPEQYAEAIAVAGRLVAGVVAITPRDLEVILMRNPASGYAITRRTGGTGAVACGRPWSSPTTRGPTS